MNANPFFVINSKNVVHENLEGEIVLIHLQTGIYYSFRGVGAEIWTMIGNGLTRTGIINDLTARYQENREEIESAVSSFLDELQKELLVLPDDSHNPTGSDEPTLAIDSKLPFQHPRLEKYTDMQEFLMVDPIHEVTDDGWPHKAPPAE